MSRIASCASSGLLTAFKRFCASPSLLASSFTGSKFPSASPRNLYGVFIGAKIYPFFRTKAIWGSYQKRSQDQYALSSSFLSRKPLSIESGSRNSIGDSCYHVKLRAAKRATVLRGTWRRSRFTSLRAVTWRRQNHLLYIRISDRREGPPPVPNGTFGRQPLPWKQFISQRSLVQLVLSIPLFSHEYSMLRGVLAGNRHIFSCSQRSD